MKSMKIFAIMAMCAVTMISASCAVNPVSTASTVDQKTYALYGEFVVFEELGAQLVKSTSTPAAVVSAIRKADATAKPAMDNALAAEQLAQAIRIQLAAGATTQDKLNVALTNLDSWVAQATPLVSNLVDAVKGAGK